MLSRLVKLLDRRSETPLRRTTRPRLETLEDRCVPSILWDNGPLITGYGDGFGGADTSAIQSGSILFGSNVRSDIFHIADDFTISDENGWYVYGFYLFSYQTGSTTTSPYVSATLQLWDAAGPGDGGSVIASTSGNLLAFTDWTGAYRVTETTPLDRNRPIMYLYADALSWGDFPVYLGAGTYWLEWSFTTTGGTGVGVWQPPTTPAAGTDNGRQYTVATDSWLSIVDDGLGQGHDLPFLVDGDVAEFNSAPGGQIPALAATVLADQAPAPLAAPLAELSLPPLATDVVEHVFALPADGQATPATTRVTPQSLATGGLGDVLSQSELFDLV